MYRERSPLRTSRASFGTRVLAALALTTTGCSALVMRPPDGPGDTDCRTTPAPIVVDALGAAVSLLYIPLGELLDSKNDDGGSTKTYGVLSSLLLATSATYGLIVRDMCVDAR